jgi:hypothetical protein
VARYLADASGGTCSNIIDLAGGGGDAPSVSQVAPALWRIGMPPGPAIIGHCFDVADPAEKIWTSAEPIGPDDPLLLDLECGSCLSEAFVQPGDGLTWLLIEHDRQCAAMAEWLAGAR